ncbi:MAG: hypothetical protein WCH62_06370, partial [Candidatus Omnitrophota bacterium]
LRDVLEKVRAQADNYEAKLLLTNRVRAIPQKVKVVLPDFEQRLLAYERVGKTIKASNSPDKDQLLFLLAYTEFKDLKGCCEGRWKAFLKMATEIYKEASPTREFPTVIFDRIFSWHEFDYHGFGDCDKLILEFGPSFIKKQKDDSRIKYFQKNYNKQIIASWSDHESLMNYLSTQENIRKMYAHSEREVNATKTYVEGLAVGVAQMISEDWNFFTPKMSEAFLGYAKEIALVKGQVLTNYQAFEEALKKVVTCNDFPAAMRTRERQSFKRLLEKISGLGQEEQDKRVYKFLEAAADTEETDRTPVGKRVSPKVFLSWHSPLSEAQENVLKIFARVTDDEFKRMKKVSLSNLRKMHFDECLFKNTVIAPALRHVRKLHLEYNWAVYKQDWNLMPPILKRALEEYSKTIPDIMAMTDEVNLFDYKGWNSYAPTKVAVFHKVDGRSLATEKEVGVVTTPSRSICIRRMLTVLVYGLAMTSLSASQRGGWTPKETPWSIDDSIAVVGVSFSLVAMITNFVLDSYSFRRNENGNVCELKGSAEAGDSFMEAVSDEAMTRPQKVNIDAATRAQLKENSEKFQETFKANSPVMILGWVLTGLALAFLPTAFGIPVGIVLFNASTLYFLLTLRKHGVARRILLEKIYYSASGRLAAQQAVETSITSRGDVNEAIRLLNVFLTSSSLRAQEMSGEAKAVRYWLRKYRFNLDRFISSDAFRTERELGSLERPASDVQVAVESLSLELRRFIAADKDGENILFDVAREFPWTTTRIQSFLSKMPDEGVSVVEPPDNDSASSTAALAKPLGLRPERFKLLETLLNLNFGHIDGIVEHFIHVQSFIEEKEFCPLEGPGRDSSEMRDVLLAQWLAMHPQVIKMILGRLKLDSGKEHQADLIRIFDDITEAYTQKYRQTKKAMLVSCRSETQAEVIARKAGLFAAAKKHALINLAALEAGGVLALNVQGTSAIRKLERSLTVGVFGLGIIVSQCAFARPDESSLVKLFEQFNAFLQEHFVVLSCGIFIIITAILLAMQFISRYRWLFWSWRRHYMEEKCEALIDGFVDLRLHSDKFLNWSGNRQIETILHLAELIEYEDSFKVYAVRRIMQTLPANEILYFMIKSPLYSASQRRIFIRLLSLGGENTAPAIVKLLVRQDLDHQTLEYVIDAAACLGGDIVPDLIHLLRTKKESSRITGRVFAVISRAVQMGILAYQGVQREIVKAGEQEECSQDVYLDILLALQGMAKAEVIKDGISIGDVAHGLQILSDAISKIDNRHLVDLIR